MQPETGITKIYADSCCGCLTMWEDGSMKEDNTKRYAGRVKYPNGDISSEYVDWFASDEDAVTGYTEIMEEQGYTVKAITFDGQNATVEIF